MLGPGSMVAQTGVAADELRTVGVRICEIRELGPAHLVGMHTVQKAVLPAAANDIQIGDVGQTARAEVLIGAGLWRQLRVDEEDRDCPGGPGS